MPNITVTFVSHFTDELPIGFSVESLLRSRFAIEIVFKGVDDFIEIKERSFLILNRLVVVSDDHSRSFVICDCQFFLAIGSGESYLCVFIAIL